MLRIIAPTLPRLTSVAHAVIAGNLIFVGGTLGTVGDTRNLAPGGIGPETQQALKNIADVLALCGATLGDVLKFNIFLSDLQSIAEMNDAYIRVIGADGPARTTVGRAALGLGAAVEIDCIAQVNSLSHAPRANI